MDTCFYFLIVDYNKSAMKIFGQIFVGISLFLLSKYVGVEFLGHSGKYIFNFLRNCQTFFHFTFYQKCDRVPVASSQCCQTYKI